MIRTLITCCLLLVSAQVVYSEEVPASIDFENDVMPVLTKFGCNAGACHGKARGQNGFQLSLLGFDPNFDYEALVTESRGRRVFPFAPEKSLLLTKPSGKSPHGGGLRLPIDSEGYQILARWVETGMPRRIEGTPKLQKITITPTDQVLTYDANLQLSVIAHYADGSTRNVTEMSDYQSNESGIAQVDEQGHITVGNIVGEAAIMARYMGQIDVCNVAVPRPDKIPADVYRALPQNNFIDGHVWNKLQRLQLKPSDPAIDTIFLRRVYIDIIGRVPTVEETEQFLAEKTPEKRQQLIDDLLSRPEYAEHWANKWADLLRPNPYRVGIKATLNYDAWIRDAFRKNLPHDEFVRGLITAQGSTFRNGAVTLFRDRRSPDELTTISSQLFLGIRLDCAKCHHHPFEVWGQDDFYSFAAYFAKVARKGTGLSTPISGSEEFVFVATKGDVKHPLTSEVMKPRPLYGEAPEIAEGSDPRKSLATWMTSPENASFAKVQVNRVWADLMGRGIVEPVDDLRATNPPTNGPLLDELAQDFIKSGFDNKHLIRRIANSYVYGMSSLPNETNSIDNTNYSRHYRKRLRAEVLLDSIVQITGQPESFDALPAGSSAKEIWTHRTKSLFLDAFGRPDPNQDPPCERTSDTSVVQTLHLMNSERLFAKVTSDKSRAAELAASDKLNAEVIQELYLLCYSRRPSSQELGYAVKYFENDEIERRQAVEDLLWALLNTPEFVFKN
ncbi:DUF1549 and DUF1553 domain-containing protein [Planctomycetaceae bacterium]|nr:DUF1549 and DUF1553 domain-containing protein [Planctomycetaceae bacterium]